MTWHIDKNDENLYFQSIEDILSGKIPWSTFKTSSYSKVVGMGNLDQWSGLMQYVRSTNLNIRWHQVCKNDIYGGLQLSPVSYGREGYNRVGLISVNTLRYVKTACEIYNYFGSLENKDIAEIGVGYGGLAYIIKCIFDPENYYLVDLPQPKQLASAYLEKLDIDTRLMDYTDNQTVYLTISEFAISELSFDLVEDYNERILKNSENIYLMCNIHDDNKWKQFLGIIEKYHNIEIHDEIPKTQWKNSLLIGRNKCINK